MFEKRLKIVLLLLFAVTAALLLRAAQVQVVDGAYWREQAINSLVHTRLIEPVRGAIVDLKGRILASEEPCIDVVVDYRAIDRDPEWIRDVAAQRVQRRWSEKPDATTRKKLTDDEVSRVNLDIDAMWDLLAQYTGKPLQEGRELIAETRDEVRRRVSERQRFICYRNYKAAVAKANATDDEPWYREWLLTGAKNPKLENYWTTVSEQTEKHAILHAISDQTLFELSKVRDLYPGLDFQYTKHRIYRDGEAAAHVMGHVGRVSLEDERADTEASNELRRYMPSDRIGRGGIEALCDSTLRGARGKVTTGADEDEVLESLDPVNGKSVHLAIDLDLQQAALRALNDRYVEFVDVTKTPGAPEERMAIVRQDLHGAVVILDIETAQVRAMVSTPAYDPNHFDELYAAMVQDNINTPLVNRATSPYQPGSVMKPLMALSASTEGVINPGFEIECDGFLHLNGRKLLNEGRCWTERMWPQYEQHHQIPTQDPHDPPPPRQRGFLNMTEAIQRSCNVFFETVAHLLGKERIGIWMDRFGLGRKTGIGIEERTGSIPHGPAIAGIAGELQTCYLGIGQGVVSVTPIQMVNYAATIARGGVWRRPSLLTDNSDARPSTRPGDDVVDLHLDPLAVAAVKEGMVRVVNTRAGTAWASAAHRVDLLVAGKTGSAQVSELAVIQRGPDGKPVKDENGRNIIDHIEPNAFPWYQGGGAQRKDLVHAWFMSFAPADHPKIAIAVVVEYGGSGFVSAQIAGKMINVCQRLGYLPGTPIRITRPRMEDDPPAPPGAAHPEVVEENY